MLNFESLILMFGAGLGSDILNERYKEDKQDKRLVMDGPSTGFFQDSRSVLAFHGSERKKCYRYLPIKIAETYYLSSIRYEVLLLRYLA